MFRGPADGWLIGMIDVRDHAVRLTGVRRTYGSGPGAVTALAGVTVAFVSGTFTAVMGPSRSGKSTLLHCAAGLDRPTDGTVAVGGTARGPLSETARPVLGRERIGFVFQEFNLMPALTARQNVELPLRLGRRRLDDGEINAALAAVG